MVQLYGIPGPPRSDISRSLLSYCVISHFYTCSCPATTNQLLPTLYTGISHPSLCLCLCFLEPGPLPLNPEVQHYLFFKGWLNFPLIQEGFLDHPSHRKSLFSTNLQCVSLCQYIYVTLSIYSNFICAQNLTLSSSRAASFPDPSYHAQAKQPGNGTLMYRPTESYSGVSASGVCRRSAQLLISSQSSVKHRVTLHK